MSKYVGMDRKDYTCNTCDLRVETSVLPKGWVESGEEHICYGCKGGSVALVFKVDHSGWGGNEKGPAGSWHCPISEGDSCPVCGSTDVVYSPGFAEGAENVCHSCGHTCFYMW